MTTIIYSSKDANSLENLVEHGKKIERERILKIIKKILEDDILVGGDEFGSGYESALMRINGMIKEMENERK